MDYLDFFSESPKVYIFNKETNKTKFGGFLFIIFIVVMIIISLAYILDFAFNNSYKVEFTRYFNSSSMMRLNNTDFIKYFPRELDQEFSFKINIRNHNFDPIIENEVNEEFVFFYNGARIYPNEIIKSKLSLMELKIYFQCQDKECKPKTRVEHYILEIKYNGFELYHQNDTDPPLQKNKNKYFLFFAGFSFDYSYYIHLKWETIKYEEERGVPKLFNPFQTEKEEYISGYISSSYSTLIPEDKDTSLRYLAYVKLDYDYTGYSQYKRKKTGFLDVLSNIGALFSTIRIFFLFFFRYYSNSFNNYKIIEKILLSKNIYSNSEIELNDDLQKPKNDINLKSYKTENKMTELLMKDTSSEKKLSINDDINEEVLDEKDEDRPLEEFPKHSFFEFFYNNIYCKCCKKRKNQEIINVYNEILFKYFSVDTILYNQIKLENILKDYHWDNPTLNNIEKNNLIIKLKRIIKSE